MGPSPLKEGHSATIFEATFQYRGRAPRIASYPPSRGSSTAGLVERPEFGHERGSLLGPPPVCRVHLGRRASRSERTRQHACSNGHARPSSRPVGPCCRRRIHRAARSRGLQPAAANSQGEDTSTLGPLSPQKTGRFQKPRLVPDPHRSQPKVPRRAPPTRPGADALRVARSRTPLRRGTDTRASRSRNARPGHRGHAHSLTTRPHAAARPQLGKHRLRTTPCARRR